MHSDVYIRKKGENTMAKRLILFSGQLDSIISTLKIISNKEDSFDFLYIKNVSFRNNEIIPKKIFEEIKKEFNNVRDLYVVDGKEIQDAFLKSYFEINGTKTTVKSLCLMCQIEIFIIYAHIMKKYKYDKIIPNIYIKSNKKLINYIFTILFMNEYDICEENCIFNHEIYDKLMPLVSKNCKCQLAISHLYQENMDVSSMDNEDILNITNFYDILYKLEMKKC